MIPLDDIQIVKSIDRKTGDITLRATLEIHATSSISSATIQSTKDTKSVEEHMRWDLSKRIWHHVYGDLQKPIFELIALLRRNVNPSTTDDVEAQRTMMELEALLK